MAKGEDYPNWAYPSKRVWRSHVRKRIKRTLKAIDDLSVGCAFYPGETGEVRRARAAIERLKDATSIKKWGR